MGIRERRADVGVDGQVGVMPQSNILLVDDQPGNLLELEAVLQPLGQNLIRAGSGDEALALAAEREFAVILLDVQMRGRDGFATAKLIRERDTTRHTPIIFLTALGDDRFTAEEAYALGGVDYLIKPVSPVILRAKVAVFVELFEKTQQVQQQAEQLRHMERREFEQRLTEENARLRESEQRFSRFMEQLPGLAWIKDAEGRYVYANDAAVTTFLTTRDGLYGKTDDEIFDAQTAAHFRENDRQALASTSGTQVIEVLEHADQTLHQSLVSKFPIVCPDGKIFVGGIAIDVTERQQQETQLREKLREIDTLMDVAPVAIVITYDPTCATIIGNRAASELLQVPLRGNLSKSAPPEEQPPFKVFRNGAEVPAHELGVQKAAARGIHVRDDEQELRFEDGTVKHIICHASPLFDDRGAVRGCIGAVLDLTAQKEAEASLKEADRRKDDFLATLAHELRNPLTPISNALQVWALAQPAGVELEELRGVMERQVQQMVRLIDDLLDVSRISKGKIQLRIQHIALEAAIRGALEGVHSLIEASEQRLTVSLPDEPLVVDADVARLTQVFGNILHNAAKYTGRGGEISVSAVRQADRAVVRIKDNGPGIPQQMLSRIFDAFQQVDQTLDRSHGGLGIGLTLVKNLVDLHGGTVEAQSAGADSGSEFIVTLPLSAETAKIPPRPMASNGLASNLPRRRVLVVDDVAASAKTLAMMLGVLGQDAAVVHDGHAAVEWIAERQPDIAFLDIAMPGMNGYEVARRIRERPAAKEVLLVALTGYGQEEDRKRALEAGFDQHLTKPASIDALRQIISNAQLPKGPAAS